MKPLLPSLWGRGALSTDARTDPFHAFHRDIDRMFEDFGRNWRLPTPPQAKEKVKKVKVTNGS